MKSMRSQLPAVAREIGADERTLRRAASRGTLRCRRSRPRHLELDGAEHAYLKTHWALLSRLTQALRTEPNVSMAALYGSAARGDDGPDADVDLLVALRDPVPGAATALAARLEQAVGRHVDVAVLDRAREQTPQLLLHALDDGRVLVDRDDQWRDLLARRAGVQAAARRARRRARQEAAESLRMLVEDQR